MKGIRQLFAIISLVALSYPHMAQAANSVEVADVVMFADPVWRSHIFRTSLDCRPSGNLLPGDITKELKKALTLRGIKVNRKGKTKVSLTIDQYSCGLAGQDKFTSYPLALGHSEKDISYAYLKISTEVVDKNTSEVISLREHFVSAPLSNSSARILFLVTDVVEERVGLEDLWEFAQGEIIDALEKDLK